MDKVVGFAVIVATVSLLAACDKSRSAAQVARDSAAAEQAAATNAARVQQKADARIASAGGEGREEPRDLPYAAAVERQKVADEAAAAGDYKGALARCEELSGATQQACRDQASADYHLARAQAEQARMGSDRKP